MTHTTHTYTTKITPAMATEWLEKNGNNRPIKEKTVRFYAEQMKRKVWMLNGASIVFNGDGTLLDGQHRLWACIEADTPFEAVVVEGISKDAFATMDNGVVRTPSDVMFVGGHKTHEKTLAAAALNVMIYKRGDNYRSKVPKHDLLRFVDDNPELLEWVVAAKATGWTSSYAASVSAVMFLASRKHPTKAREFVEKFTTGENLGARSPILVLRNRFGTEKNLKALDKVALVASAWNAFQAGRSLTRLLLIPGPLPKVVGA